MSPEIKATNKKNHLPPEQAALRKRLEKTVDNILVSVVAAGNALTEIRDKKLFRSTHDTFEQYCVEKWGFKRANAYRLIDIADISKKMSPVGYITSGRVARALKAVIPDKQKEVFRSALAAAKSVGRPVTGKDIERAAQAPLANAITEPTQVESPKPDIADSKLVAAAVKPRENSTSKISSIKEEVTDPSIESTSATVTWTPESTNDRAVAAKEVEQAEKSASNEVSTTLTKVEPPKAHIPKAGAITTTITPMPRSSGKNNTVKDKVVESQTVEPPTESTSATSWKPLESTTTQMKKLWLRASPTERDNFLAWVQDQAANFKPLFTCDCCGKTFENDTDVVSLYECNCGTRFTAQTSLSESDECPDCKQLCEQISRCGCPECNRGIVHKIDYE